MDKTIEDIDRSIDEIENKIKNIDRKLDNINKKEKRNKSIKRSQKYNPSYEVIPILKTPEIEPGDDIVIDIYWTGYGIPDECKLHIAHSGLSISEDISFQTSSVFSEFEINNNNKVTYDQVGGSSVRILREQAENSLVFSVDKNLFYPSMGKVQKVNSINNEGDKVSEDIHLALNSELSHAYNEKKNNNTEFEQRIKDEMNNKYQDEDNKDEDNKNSMAPPVQMKIPTDENQNPGSYNVTTTLTYTKDNETYNTKDSVNIKVKNWVQRHKTGFKLLTVIVALFTLVSIGANIYDVFGETINKIINYIIQ